MIHKTPPCITDEDIAEIEAEFTVGGSCACDGSVDDGCPACTDDRRVEWKSAKVKRELFGSVKL